MTGGQVDRLPAPGKSKVFNLLGNSNGSLVLHQQSRVSFVYSEQRSVGEDVSKDSSPRQRVVTFAFPRTLRRSLAQRAQLDGYGEHPRVHLSCMVLGACKAKEGSTAQNHPSQRSHHVLPLRLCYLEPKHGARTPSAYSHRTSIVLVATPDDVE